MRRRQGAMISRTQRRAGAPRAPESRLRSAGESLPVRDTEQMHVAPAGTNVQAVALGRGIAPIHTGDDLLLAVAEPGAAVDVGVRTKPLGDVRLVSRPPDPTTSRATGKTSSPRSWMALRAGGRGGVRGRPEEAGGLTPISGSWG